MARKITIVLLGLFLLQVITGSAKTNPAFKIGFAK